MYQLSLSFSPQYRGPSAPVFDNRLLGLTRFWHFLDHWPVLLCSVQQHLRTGPSWNWKKNNYNMEIFNMHCLTSHLPWISLQRLLLVAPVFAWHDWLSLEVLSPSNGPFPTWSPGCKARCTERNKLRLKMSLSSLHTSLKAFIWNITAVRLLQWIMFSESMSSALW